MQPVTNIVGLANFAAVSLVEEVVGMIVGQEGVGLKSYLQIWSVPLNVYFNIHFSHYILQFWDLLTLFLAQLPVQKTAKTVYQIFLVITTVVTFMIPPAHHGTDTTVQK